MVRDGPCGFALERQRTFKAPPRTDETATHYIQAPEGNFKIKEEEYEEILESLVNTLRPEESSYELYKITIEDNHAVESVVKLTKEEYLHWRKKLCGY